MTPEQRTLAIWGGGFAVAVIAGWIVLGARGETLAQKQGQAEELEKKYQDLYPEEGLVAADARTKWKASLDLQEAALHEAETALVPPLPRAYTDTELGTASAQVHTDLQYLKQKGQRQGAKMPAALPFEEGLDQDPLQRAIQLAQLHLYREVVDACLEAGTLRLGSVHVVKGPTDPQGKYALMLCDLELDLTFEQVDQLLLDLVQKQHRKGIGLRSLSLDQARDGSQHVGLTVSLMVANDPAWGLKAEVPKAGAKPGTAAPAGGSRLNRLGGG
ncbi:MAG: hypothetical protein H0X38_05325 [Planctomycetes bacterium]|nr:hypothetical protein [Planctomycetota bacterium]